MKISKYGSFLEVRDMEYVSDLICVQEELKHCEVPVVICHGNDGLQIARDEEEAIRIQEWMLHTKALFLLYSASLRGLDLSILLLFDLRVSGDGEYQMTELKEEYRDRFARLVGEKASYECMQSVSQGETYLCHENFVAKVSEESQGLKDYLEWLFGGKDAFQNSAILTCFFEARKEYLATSKEETIQFFRLIEHMKKGETGNERGIF